MTALAMCIGRTAALVNLALLPLVLTAAGVCVYLARQARVMSEQARQATQNAALLTTRVVSQAAPFLECEVCGATLDPRVGIGVGLTSQGQLRLRCADHEEDQP